MTVVESLEILHTLATPTDRDMLHISGFWDKNDGGGGFFIFDASHYVLSVCDFNIFVFR
jgi:hypothetical protein